MDFARLAALNWKVADLKVNYMFTCGTLTCEVGHTTAFQINKDWHADLRITSPASGSWVPDRQRIYVDEFVLVDSSDGLENAIVTLPIMGGDGEEATANATTFIVAWQGAVEPYQFGNILMRDILAIQDAGSES